MKTPAQNLLGKELEGGWKVIKEAVKDPNTTGGNFSHGYIVENNGKRGFLKAVDFMRVLRHSADPIRDMRNLTEAFDFERELVKRCKGLDRIVSGLADGKISEGDMPVPYLIFEQADGDVRRQAQIAYKFELAWILRSLHHISTGMWQLHSKGIAHQDLKPSNVMVFNGRELKIGDLGRASHQEQAPYYEKFIICGDPQYAPPELHYRHQEPDWRLRRLGCDMYLLGSMICFFVLGDGTTPLIATKLNPMHRWGNWGGTYQDVLPYVQDAFTRVVEDVRKSLHVDVQTELTKAFREMCEPDLYKRGHPHNIKTGAQYSLERYHPFFDNLARKVEIGLLAR